MKNKVPLVLSAALLLTVVASSVPVSAYGFECGPTVCGEWGKCLSFGQGEWQTRMCWKKYCPWIKWFEWNACKQCVPDWQCTEWGVCTSGIQTRTCTDVNGCGTIEGKPLEEQDCEMPKPQPVAEKPKPPVICPDGCPLIPPKGSPNNTCMMNTVVMSVCRPGHVNYNPEKCTYRPKRVFAICWAGVDEEYLNEWLKTYGNYEVEKTQNTRVGGWKFVWARLKPETDAVQGCVGCGGGASYTSVISN